MRVRAGGRRQSSSTRARSSRVSPSASKWKRLFVELGPAAVLNAKLNGKPVRNLPDGPSIVVVKPDGVRVVSTA